jgi:LemA protein
MTISYAYIFYHQRRLRTSWLALLRLYKNKFTLYRETLDIALMTYSDKSEAIKILRDGVSKCACAVLPEEYAASDKRLMLASVKLGALAKQYPLLYETERFREIESALIASEEEIAFPKQFYNDEVEKYNNRVFSVPVRAVSSLLNFRKKKMLWRLLMSCG